MLVSVLSAFDKEFFEPVVNKASERNKLIAWLASNGVDASFVYKIEFYKIDGLMMRVYEYDNNGERIFYDKKSGEPLKKNTYDILVSGLPPVRVRML